MPSGAQSGVWQIFPGETSELPAPEEQNENRPVPQRRYSDQPQPASRRAALSKIPAAESDWRREPSTRLDGTGFRLILVPAMNYGRQVPSPVAKFR